MYGIEDCRKLFDLLVLYIVGSQNICFGSLPDACLFSKQIATISANNDRDVGELITKAMEKVGKDGTITIAVSHYHMTLVL